MCGISGIISGNQLPTQATVDRLKSANTHRGPYGANYWSNDNKRVVLIHNSLPTLDSSNEAKQPFIHSEKHIICVFNGEIFNHIALREKMQLKGVHFKTTNSDTETIVNLFDLYGENCFSMLEGYFSIVIYCKKTNSCYFSRDVLGTKPLFYFNSEGRILFSSEAESLISSMEVLEIPRTTLVEYLCFNTFHSSPCPIKGIDAVSPGSYLKVDILSMKVSSHRFKSIERLLCNTRNRSDFFDYVEALKDSTRSLLNSNLKYAAAFSSGVDSPVVGAIAKVMYSSQIPLYCVNLVGGENHNEGESAVKKASVIGERVNNLFISSSTFWSHYNELANSLISTPVFCPDMIMTFELTKEIKRLGINILLTGDGADELEGYSKYLRDIENLRKGQKLACPSKIFIGQEPSRAAEYINIDVNDSLIYKLFPFIPKEGYQTEERLMRDIRLMEYNYRLPNFMIPRSERVAILNSVEIRTPFYDERMLRTFLPMEAKELFLNGVIKYRVKKLHNRIYDDSTSDKKGMGEAMKPILVNGLNERLATALDNLKLEVFGKAINIEAIKKLNASHMDDKSRFLIWTLYTLVDWLNRLSNRFEVKIVE